MQTASEGGAWGIAALARYIFESDRYTLSSYLKEVAFEDTEAITITPTDDDIASFRDYTQRFQSGLELEKQAATLFDRK